MIFLANFVLFVYQMDTGSHFSGGAVLSLESESKHDAIKELIRRAPAFTHIGNRTRLEEAVIERENIQSTACGHGIAFAHGKSDQVDDVSIVLGISKKGIRFSAPDGGPVHLLFVIASPPSDHRHYLMVLSSLARICYDRRFVREAIDKLSLKEIEKKLSKKLNQNLNRFKRKICGLRGGYETASAI